MTMKKSSFQEINESKDPYIVVLAGGKSERWTASLPSNIDLPHDKLDAVVDNETILERNIRLFKESINWDIYVFSPYVRTTDIQLHSFFWDSFEDGACPSKLHAVQSFLERSKRPVLFYFGDVVATIAAMKYIVEYSSKCHNNKIVIFGKSGPNRFTGTMWPEVYALYAPSNKHKTLFDACKSQYEDPVMTRKDFNPLYDLLEREYPSSAVRIDIGDQTDDVDSYLDYIRIRSVFEIKHNE
ncbi:hypothetical protein [Roseibium aggregatum]|uniref:hypothetical protein n=1 Tax=Roseibium aggregatum TaxID=187304 RepID=UPI0025AD395D|nr:hypothetical protein [Roseibium aggregatum]WJS05531.1 hypothetical protein QUB73_26690 [Roseibium aggregatum]